MTCVLCANVPQAIDFKTLSKHLKDYFPHPESQRYIDEIVTRANALSVSESLCSLWLLRIATSIFQDCDASSLVFMKTTNGKPYFEGSKLKFSITLANLKSYITNFRAKNCHFLPHKNCCFYYFKTVY